MKVFLSHSQSDRQIALDIAKELSDRGIAVWTEAELFPGDHYFEAVGQALDESDAMVVLLTPNASKSDWVDREIEYALSQKQYQDRLIPVAVGDDVDMDDFPWILKELDVLYLNNAKSLAEKIVRRLAPVTS